MNTIYHTYRDIAAILSFQSDTTSLAIMLSNPDFDWDNIVKIGSAHLILPTLYCQLKNKKLLSYLPKTLEEYLQEITQLNRERNEALIDQLAAIRILLNKHNISYVFLKGAALLSTGYYTDIAERMLGDIDLLIAPNQCKTAFDLFLKNGYIKSEKAKGADHRHLPRLTSKDSIAAVEIHNRLFNKYEINLLDNHHVLKNKQQINHYDVPQAEQLLLHTVLSWQLNDYGSRYNKIGFRTAYDGLIIEKEIPEILKSVLKTNQLTKKHSVLLNLFFNEYPKFKGFVLLRLLFNCRIKSPLFNQFYNTNLYVFYDLKPLLIKSFKRTLLKIRDVLIKTTNYRAYNT